MTIPHIHRWTTDLALNRMESPCVDCGKEWAENIEEYQQISDSYATDGWEATSARLTKVAKLPARDTGAGISGKPDGLSSPRVPVQIPDAAPSYPFYWADRLDAAPRDHYDGFSRLTPNQREMVVRKLAHLCCYAEHGRWSPKWGRFEHCWYVMPERLALSIARLQQYIAMLPEPLAEVAQLERDLWWKLDSDRRMDEQNAKVRAAYELSRSGEDLR